MGMRPFERWITLLTFFTALPELRNYSSAEASSDTGPGLKVSGEDPRCDQGGDVLFCDYKNAPELVEMGYSLGRSIRRVFILNAGNVLLNSSICVDVKFQNVSRVDVTDGESKPCESVIHLSAVGTKLARVPEHISKIYIEDSVVGILKTQSGLQMLIVLNSKITTLDIPTPLAEGTAAVLQDSDVASLRSLIVSNRSSIIFRKTIVEEIIDEGLVVHSGGEIKLDNSCISNVTKGGISLAPEGYVVLENVSGRLEVRGFSLKETLDCAKDRVQLENTEATVSFCDCITGEAYKVSLFIFTSLLVVSLLVNVALLRLIMKKNKTILELKFTRISEDSALINMKEEESLEINGSCDGPTNRITEGNMIPSHTASTHSDGNPSNDETTEKELLPEELERRTNCVLEKLNHIQNKITKAEESLLSESGKSCSLESINKDFHDTTRHYDNYFDERINALTRHGEASRRLFKSSRDVPLQRISQLKTSLGKAKAGTRAYLEYRVKLSQAIRRESYCDEQIKKYEEVTFDVLLLLKEIRSSLETTGLQSKTNVFLKYVHDEYESLFEAQRRDYKKRETEIRACSESNDLTELLENWGVYNKPFPTGDFESEMFSVISKIPDCRNIPEESFDGSLDKLSSQIDRKAEIIQLKLSHEDTLLSYKQAYLRERDCDSSIVLRFLKNALLILVKMLTTNSTGNEPKR
ncbi:uncharacterized protein LOC135224344 [Macrobrachium nipponense]|uniref:uncharacterized protein LOC135224344 n=1 Tax=Macrobrachium nipponense TaxID=159736 RepID=UPI0030C82CC5